MIIEAKLSVVGILSAVKLRLFSAIVVLFVLSSVLTVSVSASSSQEAAVSSIFEAEEAVAQAYEAVLDAEAAGANVSSLLARLNDAAELLSEAHMAFEADDFEEALGCADLAREVGWEVGSDAEWLEAEANRAGVNTSRWLIVVSVVGVAVVVFASLLSYRIFKRRYFRRLLKMRPKVGKA